MANTIFSFVSFLSKERERAATTATANSNSTRMSSKIFHFRSSVLFMFHPIKFIFARLTQFFIPN